MPVAARLLAEGKMWTTFGPLRLGAVSKPFAVIMVFGVLVLVVAGIQPPFDINYAIGMIVLLLALRFGVERRRLKGPPVGREIDQRQAESWRRRRRSGRGRRCC